MRDENFYIQRFLMTQQYLLSLEVRTLEQSEFDADDLLPMTIFCNADNNYFLATGVEDIRRAILGLIPHLGSNCRQSLSFSVRVLPGEAIDALLYSISYPQPPNRRVRRR